MRYIDDLDWIVTVEEEKAREGRFRDLLCQVAELHGDPRNSPPQRHFIRDIHQGIMRLADIELLTQAEDGDECPLCSAGTIERYVYPEGEYEENRCKGECGNTTEAKQSGEGSRPELAASSKPISFTASGGEDLQDTSERFYMYWNGYSRDPSDHTCLYDVWENWDGDRRLLFHRIDSKEAEKHVKFLRATHMWKRKPS